MYLSYLSVAVVTHHDRGNLWKKEFIGAHCFKRVESTTIMVRSWLGTGAVPESLYLVHK